MKFLSEKDVNECEFVPVVSVKRSKVEAVYASAALLIVGGSLFIGKEDWLLKNAPTASVIKSSRNFPKHYVISVRTLKDGSGWVVTRLR
jgi:hypothetical protein